MIHRPPQPRPYRGPRPPATPVDPSPPHELVPGAHVTRPGSGYGRARLWLVVAPDVTVEGRVARVLATVDGTGRVQHRTVPADTLVVYPSAPHDPAPGRLCAVCGMPEDPQPGDTGYPNPRVPEDYAPTISKAQPVPGERPSFTRNPDPDGEPLHPRRIRFPDSEWVPACQRATREGVRISRVVRALVAAYGRGEIDV